jgi:ornithine carbamoyltransferase
MNLHGRSLRIVTDLSAEEFTHLITLSRELRTEKRLGYRERRLEGRNIALIFLRRRDRDCRIHPERRPETSLARPAQRQRC